MLNAIILSVMGQIKPTFDCLESFTLSEGVGERERQTDRQKGGKAGKQAGSQMDRWANG